MRQLAALWCVGGVLVGSLASCTPVSTPVAREPVVGLPCEGCEAVFDGMPKELSSSVRLGAADEPGVPLRLTGVVRDEAGKPRGGIVLYFYQTDASGLYPPGGSGRTPDGKLHGRLRGWARTGSDGTYTVETIRPGGYPGDIEPEHIHIHVLEPGRCTYYIDDVVFEDDPRLTAGMRARQTGRGGPGIVMPTKDGEGRWIVTRDITLGKGISGYPAR